VKSFESFVVKKDLEDKQRASFSTFTAIMREPVEIASIFKETMEKMKGPGVILLAGDPPNPMTIGWGTIGYIWGKWIFTVLVRPSRFTFQMMESADDFTLNLFSDEYSNELSYCGSKSGRDVEKIRECGFTLEPGIAVSTPYISESMIHFECRIIHKNKLDPHTLDPDISRRYYPEQDFHMVYYGEIIGAYTS
jgi:flavin reductase (DIM6/NTAB) family NADH-FMN oxidoreductase RutF